MSGIWGRNIRYSIFGESHGGGIGIVIDGLPPGVPLDLEDIAFEMNRRRPGGNALVTPRKEPDQFEILSGYFQNRTTGTPLCVLIRNTNQQSKDYESLRYMMRPGHADYTGYVKYSGFNDYRGGGHFSGRLTAPLVFAGAVAKQLLKKERIVVGSHILQIGNVLDQTFDDTEISEGMLYALRQKKLAVIDETKISEMEEQIFTVKKEKDSIGGIIETAVIHLPAGLGNPFFDSVESCLAHLLFSIPAVKGVEFGAGFSMAGMRGSEANDGYYMAGEKIKTLTNYNGGILGGITNGMPLIFRVVIKPTPSIAKSQKTVNVKTKENAEITVEGRHDPCIVPRAVPVVEAAAAMVILDLLYDRYDI